MTKEEMMKKYYPHSMDNNYEEAQKHINEAMEAREKYVYLLGKNSSEEFLWTVTPKTISRLRDDGFAISFLS